MTTRSRRLIPRPAVGLVMDFRRVAPRQGHDDCIRCDLSLPHAESTRRPA